MSETKTDAIGYFWMISADFMKQLPEPVTEYHEDGYSVKTAETGMGFMGDIYFAKSGEIVTRMSLFCHAIRKLVESQNKGRRAAGKTLMFDDSNVIVKAFHCGRNEL